MWSKLIRRGNHKLFTQIYVQKLIQCGGKTCTGIHVYPFFPASNNKKNNYRFYCTSFKKSGDSPKILSKPEEFKTIINKNKLKLKGAEHKLLEKGQIILKDIKETKEKVKETVEGIIEV